MSSTLARVTEVFRDVFEDETLEVTRDTSARDIEDWDSLMHVSLVVAVEREFAVRFSSGDVARLHDVGALVDLIERHAGAGG